MRNVAAGANPMILKKGIETAVKKLVEEIKSTAKPIESKGAIAQVATISSADEEIGNYIADAMEKVGKDGVITVEESKGMDTNLSVVEGMNVDLIRLSQQVATTLVPIERDVVSVNGKPYFLRIAPYRAENNKVLGLVM